MRTLHALSVLSAALLLAGAGPAAAQYKVVGPDGRVAYTKSPRRPLTDVWQVAPGGVPTAVTTDGRSDRPVYLPDGHLLWVSSAGGGVGVASCCMAVAWSAVAGRLSRIARARARVGMVGTFRFTSVSFWFYEGVADEASSSMVATSCGSSSHVRK